jgi:hypothetical protein
VRLTSAWRDPFARNRRPKGQRGLSGKGEHFDNCVSKRVQQTESLPTPALQVEEREHHPTLGDR